MRSDPDDAGLRRYLLGLLPEAEAEALEDAYLARPEVWELVRGAEDDLLDDYAAGRLDPGEQEALERRYLASAPLRERVVAARALRLAAQPRFRAPATRFADARPTRWALPVALAAGLLLALLSERSWRPRPPHETSAAARPVPAMPWETSPPAQTIAPTASAVPSSPLVPPRQPPTRPLVLALSPVLLRGEERSADLRIPPGTEAVLLELEGDPASLPEGPSALEATLETVEGEPVWRGNARRVTDAARPSLIAVARVPAARLAPSDYLLRLSTRDKADGALHSYFFRVSP